jgi:hypothetical protein
MRTTVCVRHCQKAFAKNKRQQALLRWVGWCGVVWCGGCEYVRNSVCSELAGWVEGTGGGEEGEDEDEEEEGLAEVVERSVFLHPSDCRPERLEWPCLCLDLRRLAFALS